jgi:hypothetical protein
MQYTVIIEKEHMHPNPFLLQQKRIGVHMFPIFRAV